MLVVLLPGPGPVEVGGAAVQLDDDPAAQSRATRNVTATMARLRAGLPTIFISGSIDRYRCELSPFIHVCGRPPAGRDAAFAAGVVLAGVDVVPVVAGACVEVLGPQPTIRIVAARATAAGATVIVFNALLFTGISSIWDAVSRPRLRQLVDIEQKGAAVQAAP